MKKIRIALDKWKLPIFKKVLDEAGYTYTEPVNFCADAFMIHVETDDTDKLALAVQKANNKAAKSKNKRWY